MVPFGGGTSLEGQVLSPEGAVSLDFKNMAEVVAFNEKVRGRWLVRADSLRMYIYKER